MPSNRWSHEKQKEIKLLQVVVAYKGREAAEAMSTKPMVFLAIYERLRQERKRFKYEHVSPKESWSRKYLNMDAK